MELFASILLAAFWLNSFAQSISPEQARIAAANQIQRVSAQHNTSDCLHYPNADSPYFVFELKPQGYIIVTTEKTMTPVYGWSLTGEYEPGTMFDRFVCHDIQVRQSNLSHIPTELKRSRVATWDALLTGYVQTKTFEQWPAPGTTATEGWLEENWTQNYPYNAMCPMDMQTSARSIAGCPAVAMGSILHFHETLNGVSFSDLDDYYHNYAGRQYWIDDDADGFDFPAFPVLNKLLDTAQTHYSSCQGADDTDKGALVFACGVACTQVFTSSGSGTFGVSQALQGYQKFNFTDAELVDDTHPDIYTRISNNIIDTLPVHLAVVDPGWTMGHNVVIDGYNTDGYFHLNFGWGGPYNGWYALPDEIPYGLTVIEGAVVDIIPSGLVGLDNNQIVKESIIFPNPSTGMVYISTTENVKEVIVCDLTGKRLLYFENKSACDLSGLTKGIYLITIKTENSVFSEKISLTE